MLVEGFQQHWPNAWPELDSALAQVQESLAAEPISRIAIDDTGAVVGWIGGIKHYNRKVWELHPLVVHVSCQGKGIGRTLVADLEEQVGESGGLTLWVGTDDENHMTREQQ
ncbi:MAG: GNAT family N-acetyltransferase [Coleofasciculus sp. Co-bin14]|nr:GNAT family N-acetyltransferase [Coleofasciculus sp. Co-bin14]